MAGEWDGSTVQDRLKDVQPEPQVVLDVAAPGTITNCHSKESGQLWVNFVPREVVDSVSDKEKMRQCVINEVICVEHDFVRDLEYLRDTCMAPLRTANIIPEERRADFVQQVFWNIEEIIDVSTRLRDLLTERQKAHPVVETIGDIFLELFPHFAPFVQYIKHHLFGEYEFKKEKASNPAFAEFVETFKNLPASRRLELNEYLAKPLAKLKRYPSLLEAVLRNTSEDNADWVAISKAVELARDLLKSANEEYIKAEDRLGLLQLDKGLVFRPGEEVNLNLMHERRKLVYKGSLKRRGRTTNDDKDVQVFLLDHAVVVAQSKMVDENEQLKVIRRPIPLELLVVSTPEEVTRGAPGTRAAQTPVAPNSQEEKRWLRFSRLGRWGYSLALCAPTATAQRGWLDCIATQMQTMREQTMVFDTFVLGEVLGGVRVNCVVPYGKWVAYGTDAGVFFGMLNNGKPRAPVKVLDLPDVQQIDILEDCKLLVVRSGNLVLTFPLDVLEPPDPANATKRMKRISSHATFFKVGRCLNRPLVCVVKGSSISSTVKVLEPINQNTRRKSTLDRLLQSGNDSFKVFREFYLPTEIYSIHFLKTKLCMACTRGFEVVDLETLDTQALLDPADASLNFLQSRQYVRPVNIYRIDQEFLLCYTEFAFYVNKSGWRSRPDVTIYWEGFPTAFALHYPYVMAFDPTLVEIRHVKDGAPVQAIHGKDIRCFFAENQPSKINSSSTRSPIFRDPQIRFNDQHDQSGQATSGHTPHTARSEVLPDQPWRDKIIFLSDNQVTGIEKTGPLSGAPVTPAPGA